MKRIETTFPNKFRKNPILGDTTRPSLIGLKRTEDGILTREACRRCKKEMWRYKHLLGRFCYDCSPFRFQPQNAVNKLTCYGYRYIFIRKDNFFAPMRNNTGQVFEHRLVMAKHLGRCLHHWEFVHHKNSIKDDNRIENLQLISTGEHGGLTILNERIRRLRGKYKLLHEENLKLKKELSNRAGV